MFGVAVRCEPRAQVEAFLSVGDEIQNHRADHLRNDIRWQLRGLEPAAAYQPDANGRIEVTTRDMADRECHRQHRQSECQRNAQQTDADLRKRRSQHRAAAAAQHQPECADEFRGTALRKRRSLLASSFLDARRRDRDAG